MIDRLIGAGYLNWASGSSNNASNNKLNELVVSSKYRGNDGVVVFPPPTNTALTTPTVNDGMVVLQPQTVSTTPTVTDTPASRTRLSRQRSSSNASLPLTITRSTKKTEHYPRDIVTTLTPTSKLTTMATTTTATTT
jgi:hypothetical protein